MVKVDRNKCIGCGACASVCPEGFEIIDGRARVKSPEASCIKEGANVCPVRAILVEK